MTTLDRYRQNQLRDNPVFCGDVQTAFMVDRRPTASPNNGTYSGSYSFQPGPFAGSRAIRLDGSSGYAALGTGSYLSKWTIGAWVNPASLSGYGIVLNRGSAQDRNYNIYINPTSGLATASYTVANNAYVECSSSVACRIGSWTYVAASYDGTTLRLYVNGQLNASVTGGPPGNAAGGIASGTYGSVNLADFFNGAIWGDEIYNYALSPSRFLSRYQIATGQQQTRRIYSIPATINNFWFDGVQTAA